MKSWFTLIGLFIFSQILGQTQTCPLNNSFSNGDLTHWWAYTGNNQHGNGPSAQLAFYDSTVGAPSGTLGNPVIYEYQLPSVPGIQVVNSPSIDLYGQFYTIPTINGYKYTNSVLLGSTSITRSGNGTAGGYVRGISYRINVPATPVNTPYTMTYAYAMVLENGTHNSNEQPLFTATLSTNAGIIACASPKYFLPTFNNAGGGNGGGGTGATLDTATALKQGFKLSRQRSPNPNPNGQGPNPPHLQDVWYKTWTEVTFDLSPYRGQQVVLTFETDNCVPGGHFAYSYVALRNVCDGLQISGPLDACVGSNLVYSVPSLANATYQWGVPSGWTIVSGADSNILTVTVADLPNGGTIKANEQNSCANLSAQINVKTSPPTIPGSLAGDNEVCTGPNSNTLTLTGNRGSVLNWVSSPDGVTWTPLSNTATLTQYDAINLTQTTLYKVVVQNGQSCDIDSTNIATIKVDPLSVGGQINPAVMDVCLNQDKDATLTLTGNVGSVVNWQTSPDGFAWTDMNPAYTNAAYYLMNLANSTYFRTTVRSGVCPPTESAPASVTVLLGLFPQATIAPADTSICYGTPTSMRADITVGTSFTWNGTFNNGGDGPITSLPFDISASATPLSDTNFILSIYNTGCPNPRIDTFHVDVIPPIIVNPGNDTAVVVNQPLQFNASANNPDVVFSWTPSSFLNNPNIPNPLAIYPTGDDSIRYLVTATTPIGCQGSATILVKIYSTDANIFMPNAFTPGGATNRVFRPIAVGISSLQYFRIFNRWGQMVFNTNQLGRGWDGYYNGKIMEPGTYVWVIQATTYLGKVVTHKGTMIMVR